jgi:uncharacterized protein YlaN (UPF0358 family)
MMLGLLEVVIGLIFVLLLLSLLATTVMELLSSGLALRGKNLEKALRNMLASADAEEKVFRQFKQNPLYKQLSQRYGKSRRRSPSYLSSGSFQSILFDVLLEGEGIDRIQERIDSLPDRDLKQVLNQLLTDADYRLDEFRSNIRNWYDNVMDRASGWYKRNIQKILVAVGLAIAVIFNADTIAIYERLESDPEALQQILTMAEDYLMVQGDSLTTTQDPVMRESLDKINHLISREIDEASAPLGLGWGGVDIQALTWQDWALKVLGWIVTALAVSLGAPFWFDLLKKLVNIRGSGEKPKAKA